MTLAGMRAKNGLHVLLFEKALRLPMGARPPEKGTKVEMKFLRFDPSQPKRAFKFFEKFILDHVARDVVKNEKEDIFYFELLEAHNTEGINRKNSTHSILC